MKRKVLIGVFCGLLGVFFAFGVEAVELKFIKDLNIDQITLLRGYTVSSSDENFFVGIRPEVLAQETRVVIKQYDRSQFIFPEGFTAISDVYEFDIFNKQAFQNHKPLLLRFVTSEATNNFKRIFFYNGVKDQWQELPSYADGLTAVKSVIHLPYAKLVILKDNNMMEYGAASWYAYKNCDCAASPDYPKGSILEVTNLENNKSVLVRVNDYGPDRAIHPERIIDLDKVAFQKLGNLRQGILPQVSVKFIK